MRKDSGKIIDFVFRKTILVREIELIIRQINWKKGKFCKGFSALQTRRGTVLNEDNDHG